MEKLGGAWRNGEGKSMEQPPCSIIPFPSGWLSPIAPYLSLSSDKLGLFSFPAGNRSHKDLAKLKKQNQQLIDENNLLKMKVELLLDMVSVLICIKKKGATLLMLIKIGLFIAGGNYGRVPSTGNRVRRSQENVSKERLERATLTS